MICLRNRQQTLHKGQSSAPLGMEEPLENEISRDPATMPLCHSGSSKTQGTAGSTAPSLVVFVRPLSLIGSNPERMSADADEHFSA